ncbi:MAG: hypothetical protein DRN09_02620 [Thermoplasmata archaeon]|nr:MAG: hypothetical protein DRN09_02620 [Thermoplasmata archaeon]
MMKRLLDNKHRIIGAFILIIAGVLGRIYLRNFLPNTPSWYITINGITQPVFMMDLFFVVAVISLLSGLLLRGYYTFIVPFLIMLITDIYYGNNYIFLFTWSGFILIALLGFLISNRKSTLNIPVVMGTGIVGVLLYDLWTNFGCWLGWYPHTLNGLILCYTVAIPFTLWHLLSTVAAISVIVIPAIYLKEHGLLNINYVSTPTETKVTTLLSAALMVLSPILLFL